ncbi:MAG: small multi-drug export protein [Methanomassiliicoccales archaeon]|nr:MAG: small multi-drug export protein [Methanomassiliicoccales archaeon]
MSEEKSRLARKTIEDKDEIKIDEVKDVLETKPEKKSKGIILAQFFVPWLIALLFIAGLYIFLPSDKFTTLGFWMLVYFFPPFGKESVIPLAIAGDRLGEAVPWEYPEMFVPIDPWLIAISVAFLDIIVGLFLVWNFDLAKKIPIMGRWITKLEKKGGTILKENRYIEALSFVGVVLFVMFPFQGSGGVGASIVGRAIGMNPYKVWVAIIIGAISGCFLIAYAADSFFKVFMENRILGLLILVLIVALAAVLILKRRKNREKIEDEEEN